MGQFWGKWKTNVAILFFQPPKKKGGKKGGKKKKSAKAKTPTVIDGVSTEEMSKEQVPLYSSVRMPGDRKPSQVYMQVPCICSSWNLQIFWYATMESELDLNWKILWISKFHKCGRS